MIEMKLRKEHQGLIEKMTILSHFVEQERYPNPLELAHARWNLNNLIIQHLVHEDRTLYHPMIGHRDPHISKLGEEYYTEIKTVFDRFFAHASEWTPREPG